MIQANYPRSIRDVSPGPDAVRLTGKLDDGRPSGAHTGGAWLYQGDVWKPLDGGNAHEGDHCPTNELACLGAMAGHPLFETEFRYEERNGRRWLVREYALLIPEDIDYDQLDKKAVLYIEQGVYNMNRCGWELQHPLGLAVDCRHRPFIYDCSTAMYRTQTSGAWAPDDSKYVNELLEKAWPWLCKLRRNAKGVKYAEELNRAIFDHDEFVAWMQYQHVYASFRRPFSTMWATLPEKPYLISQSDNWEEGIPYTWILTCEPLPQEILDRYELDWGWSPIHPQS